MKRRIGMPALVTIAIAAAAIAATAPNQGDSALVQSHDGPYEFSAPTGWTVQQVDGSFPQITLTKSGEHIALVFHPSEPGEWSVASLMSSQDIAVRRSFGDVEPTDKRVMQTGTGPAALWLYNAKGAGPGPPTPFAGCVILDNGGVGVVGLALHRETVKVVDAIIRSVRPTSPHE